jgi:hypothetical protein
MLQVVPSEDPCCPLLVFYDSGCSAAVLSDRAHYSLNPFTVSKGPTTMDVAGGKTLTVPYGNERFHLQVEDGVNVKATITGLRMAHVTTPFPLMKLKEAWKDAKETARRVQPRLSIPNIDAEVGGQEVDILLGIRYLKYFPKLLFTLPSGLQVYRAVLKSESGNQAVLGGPHKAWNHMISLAQHMNPRAYLTAEARAYIIETSWPRLGQIQPPVPVEELEEVSSSSLAIETPASEAGPCCNCAREEETKPSPEAEAAPLGGLRGRPADEWILLFLILLAYGTFIAGEKICRHILTFAQPFCLHVCRGFSEMFRGLFYKQGVGGFTSESAEAENSSLKPNVVVHGRAEAKPPDGRTHWGTASPPSTFCKISR